MHLCVIVARCDPGKLNTKSLGVLDLDRGQGWKVTHGSEKVTVDGDPYKGSVLQRWGASVFHSQAQLEKGRCRRGVIKIIGFCGAHFS